MFIIEYSILVMAELVIKRKYNKHLPMVYKQLLYVCKKFYKPLNKLMPNMKPEKNLSNVLLQKMVSSPVSYLIKKNNQIKKVLIYLLRFAKYLPFFFSWKMKENGFDIKLIQ